MISEKELKFCLRAISRAKFKKGRTYSFKDLRIKIDGGKFWVWKTHPKSLKPFEYLENKGLDEFYQYLSSKELDFIFNTELDSSIFDELKKTYPLNSKINIVEAFENIRILNHILNVIESFGFVLNIKESDRKDIIGSLKKRGHVEIVDENGISDSLESFLELNKIALEIKSDPIFYKSFLASLWFHDLGKIISGVNHPNLSKKIIQSNLKENLLKIFTEEQLKYIAHLVSNHSMISDTASTMEPKLSSVLRKITLYEGKKEERIKLLKALLLISICDVDSYNRLSNERIKFMFEIYENAVKLINGEVDFESVLNNASWGEFRFKNWIVGLNSKDKNKERDEAMSEFLRLFPNEIDRAQFFEQLGNIERVNLIFDLINKIESPALRVKLIKFVVDLFQKYKDYTWCEFCISRSFEDILEKEVFYLSVLLKDYKFEKMEKALNFKFDKEKKGIAIYIPVS